MIKNPTIFLLAIFLLFIQSSVRGQVIYDHADSIKYNDYIAHFCDMNDEPIADLVVKAALYFKDSPYVASTLEKAEVESLVVNLKEFDCNTFVESCLALAITLKSTDHSFENYCNVLQDLRYRDGIVDGYTSRLHYVSDWIFDNAKKGLLSDKTSNIGGEKRKKEFNFMSSHADSYPILKNNSDIVYDISCIENEINLRDQYVVLSKQDIKLAESCINDGDIIAFATSIDGLDYSHIGIAYHLDGELRFIHASTRTMTVVVEPRSLSDYCLQSKKCIGISVFNLNSL